MNPLPSRRRLAPAGLAVPALTLAAVLSALVLVAWSPPAAAAIDGWAEAEHPRTGDQQAVSDPAVPPFARR